MTPQPSNQPATGFNNQPHQPTSAEDPRPRAYSYARFSSPQQAKGDSLRRQTEKARAYAARHDLRFEDRSFHDLGISAFRGANISVGRLGEFMRAVQDGLIPRGSYLLVENLDRISRQTARKAARTLEQIVDEGIILVTLDDERVYSAERLDDAPFEFLWVVIKFARAWEESERKGILGRANWLQKRRLAKSEGRPMTSRCPAWLQLVDGHYEAIPERAAVVRRIFELAAKGVGQQQIADILNGEGVPTFGDQTRRRAAEFWRRSYIKKIIESDAVVGVLRAHQIEHVGVTAKQRRLADVIPDYYPPVVDRDLFDRVTAMRSADTAAPRAGPKGVRNVLAGLAKCPRCGATMTRVTKGSGSRAGKPYLVCTRAKDGHACDYVSVPLHRIEAALCVHSSMLRDQVPSHDEALERQLKRWGDEYAASNRRIAEITDALADGPSAELATLLKQERERSHGLHEGLQRALADAEGQTSPALRERLLELDYVLNDTPAELGEPDTALANALLRQCFTSVTVDYEREVIRLFWRVGGEAVLAFGPKGEKYQPFFYIAVSESGTMRPIDGKEDLGPAISRPVQSSDGAVSATTNGGMDKVLPRLTSVLRYRDLQPSRRRHAAHRSRAAQAVL